MKFDVPSLKFSSESVTIFKRDWEAFGSENFIGNSNGFFLEMLESNFVEKLVMILVLTLDQKFFADLNKFIVTTFRIAPFRSRYITLNPIKVS